MAKAHPISIALSEQLITRFWSKIKKGQPDECWEWQGKISHDGYGCFSLGKRGRSVRAHRLALHLESPTTESLFACHRCDNPPCCNPRHLFWGTIQDNLRDAFEKGRHAHGDTSWPRKYPEMICRGSRHGQAKLNEEKVLIIRARYAAGGISLTKLAREYSVDVKVIHRVVRRETWTHV